MPKITYVTSDGSRIDAEVEKGYSVMEGAINNNVAGIVAECGGLIYLSEGIRTVDGRFHKLCGVLPASCEMHPKRVALGYRQLTVTEDGPFGPTGTMLRGHEFRYSEVDRAALSELPQPLTVTDRRGRPCATDTYRVGNTWASYAHLVVTEQLARHWVNHLAQMRV